MHVQQPWELFAGVVLLLVGVPGLARDLYRAYTRTFRATYADWRMLGLSLWFAGAGPAYCSRAFDPPGHDSHRTAILSAVAMWMLLLAVVSCSVAWAMEWRRKRAEAGAARPAV